LTASFFVDIPHELIVNLIRCIILGVDLGEPSRQLLLAFSPFFRRNWPDSPRLGIDIRRPPTDRLPSIGRRRARRG
jgi:hypothetical protein